MTDIDDKLLDAAEIYAKAFGVSVRTAIEAVRAEKKLDDLARAHNEAFPDLAFQQSYDLVLDTPEGEAFYAKANPRPERKTKAVQVSVDLMYRARITLLGKLHERLNTDDDFAKRVGPSLSSVPESRLVDEALKLLIKSVSNEEDEKGDLTGIEYFDK